MGKRVTVGLKPVHPGEFLREDILPNVKMAKTDIAKALGISRALLYAILNERASVTAPIALRLGKFFANGPELWLHMQGNYDIAILRLKLAKDLDRIPFAPAA